MSRYRKQKPSLTKYDEFGLVKDGETAEDRNKRFEDLDPHSAMLHMELAEIEDQDPTRKMPGLKKEYEKKNREFTPDDLLTKYDAPDCFEIPAPVAKRPCPDEV